MDHRNIAKYRKFVESTEHNTDLIVEDWNRRINKNDVVYVMGDAAFSFAGLSIYGELPGRKILVKGNHDDYTTTKVQIQYFEEIYAMIKYKKMWLSHCPIHPAEMRRCIGNVHAHVHEQTIQKRHMFKTIDDPQYLNTCVDVIFPAYGSVFISLEEVRDEFKRRGVL